MLICFTINNSNQGFDFEYIYKKYKNTVYKIICKRISDRSLAEDTMQNTFVNFYKTMDKMQTENDAKCWLFRIAKNASIDLGDKEERYKNHIGIWLDDEEVYREFLDKTSNKPLDEILKKELAVEIASILKTLKPIHAEVITLKYFYGLTALEISKIKDISVDTIYSRLAKGRSILYNSLSLINSGYISEAEEGNDEN